MTREEVVQFNESSIIFSKAKLIKTEFNINSSEMLLTFASDGNNKYFLKIIQPAAFQILGDILSPIKKIYLNLPGLFFSEFGRANKLNINTLFQLEIFFSKKESVRNENDYEYDSFFILCKDLITLEKEEDETAFWGLDSIVK